MQAHIITVGDEIIGGQTADTNSSYLASRLSELGIRVRRISSIGDEVDAICAELRAALESADVVLVTGGLGPTEDDVTKHAVARVLGKELVLDRDLHARLAEGTESRRSASARAIEALALVPKGAVTIGNPVGAAVGLSLQYRGSLLFVLPGVPREMKSIFEGGIACILKDLPKDEISGTRVIKTTGIRESEIAVALAPVVGDVAVKLGYLPRPEGVDLRLTAIGPGREAVTEKLEQAVLKVMPLLGSYAFSSEGEELNLVVGNMLLERGMSLAVAESCTGGLIGHLLTQVPGISACLDRDIVAYSNRAKVEELSVDEDLIERRGAVSREVAEAMATGARELAGSDLGLSTTGIAGPGGGTSTKPVGLVYVGLAHRGGCLVSEKVFKGSREIVKLRAAVRALDLVRKHLTSGEG
jgi:nicotinamide-nucleotide amidase